MAERYLPPGARQKIYLILASASLALLSFGIWQAYPVVVADSDPLGLASRLPTPYWVGLALIVITSIFAFLDTELKKDAIFISILLVLGLFLFGVKTLFQENAGDPTVYAPLGDVRRLLASYHINIAHPPNEEIQTYYVWPAFHFINASILHISGVTFSFIKYMPLYFLLAFVLVTYGIGKRLKLSANHCFLISFLSLSSWLIVFAGLYYPRMYAMILFLLLFMLLLVPGRTIAGTLAVILLFAVAAMTHGMVSIALIPGLALLAIYHDRRDISLILLFITISLAWYLYQATLAFDIGIQTLTRPFLEILRMTQVERYQVPVASTTLAIRYSRMAYLAAYAALVAAGAIMLLAGKISGERRKQVISLFAFTIGTASIVVFGFGEQVYRTYLYCLVPVAAIIALTVLFSLKRKIVAVLTIFLMWLFVALYLPANFASEVNWGQVFTTELRGTEFFALRVKPRRGAAVFYTYGAQLIYFYAPDLRGMVSFPAHDYLYNEWLTLRPFYPKMTHPFLVIDRSRRMIDYIIISNQGIPFAPKELYWKDWAYTTGARESNIIYNNGNLQIYDNRLWSTK